MSRKKWEHHNEWRTTIKVTFPFLRETPTSVCTLWLLAYIYTCALKVIFQGTVVVSQCRLAASRSLCLSALRERHFSFPSEDTEHTRWHAWFPLPLSIKLQASSDRCSRTHSVILSVQFSTSLTFRPSAQVLTFPDPSPLQPCLSTLIPTAKQTDIKEKAGLMLSLELPAYLLSSPGITLFLLFVK